MGRYVTLSRENIFNNFPLLILNPQFLIYLFIEKVIYLSCGSPLQLSGSLLWHTGLLLMAPDSWLQCACGSSSLIRMNPGPSVGAWSLIHWTTRAVCTVFIVFYLPRHSAGSEDTMGSNKKDSLCLQDSTD